MNNPPSLEWIENKLAGIFADRVVGPVIIAGWSVAFTVSTERLAKITGDEIAQLWQALDIRPSDVEFAVSVDGDGLEFYVGLDSLTPVDVEPPRVKRRK